MSGTLDWVISLSFITLFTIAIISFATYMAYDNNSPVNVANDPEINNLSSNLNSNAGQFKSEAETSYASIINSTIEPGSDTTKSAGQYSYTSNSTTKTATNIIEIGYKKIFGSSNGTAIFLTTFLGLIVIITFAYLIKLWRTGLSD